MDRCLACDGTDLSEVIDFGDVPVMCGVFYKDATEAAAAPVGQLQLAACRRCSHVQNIAFDKNLVDYDGDYDNSLHFSPLFQSYTAQLVAHLTQRYDLDGKEIVEIGSGKGDFLIELSDTAGATGTGYDPTYEGAAADHPRVTFKAEYFPIGNEPQHFDLLVARHVLEHLTDPRTFLRGVADAVSGTQSVVYLEVPAAEFDFGADGLWDFIYPHVSYFSQESLVRLVNDSGLGIIDVRREYAGQFLCIEIADPSHPMARSVAAEPDPEHHEHLAGFATRWRTSSDSYRAAITRATSAGREAVLWGIGSKGVTFLTTIDPGKLLLGGVDLNPNKWGNYVPLSLHQVLSPESLRGQDVATVFLTNGIYADEIRAKLDELGLPQAQIVVAL